VDYKEQIDQAKNAATKWREKHPIVGVGELRVDCMVDDLCRYIADLLACTELMESRARKADQCISNIEDDLDRGNDNDWAREHIAEYRRDVENGRN
jgi:hypothetical protein